MSLPSCPDPETLATVLDGVSSDELRERVLDHLGTCETCYATFVESARFQLDLEAAARAATTRRLVTRVAAGLAFVAASLAFAWPLLVKPLLTERPVDPLVAAVEGRRPLEARLTGGFPHAPFPGPTRAIDVAPQGRERWEMANAALRVDRLARRRSSAGRVETLGLAHLLTGDAETASLLIGEALDRRPDDPAFLTDLAATHHARYREGAPDALIEALVAADAAAEKQPDLPEALFNRALALSAFHLQGEGRLAWRRYAAVESELPWTAEARRREAAIGSPGPPPDVEQLVDLALAGGGEALTARVAAHPQEVRTYLQETLLPRWGSQWLDGDASGADRSLQAADPLARALLERTRDPMLSRAVEEIRGALRDTSSARLAHLARGHASFGAGRQAFESLSPNQSRAAFEDARRHLEAAGSPYALWARVWEQGCAYLQGEPDDAILAELLRLRKAAEGGGYRLALARIQWLEGLIHFVDLEIPESLAAYTRALDLMLKAGEEGHTAFLHFLVSQNYLVLGDRRHGWRHRIEALETASRADAGNKYPGILLGTGMAALWQGYPGAALYFFREAGRVADDELARTESALWLARTLAALGRRDEAARSLARARSEMRTVGDAALLKRLRAEASVVAGVVAGPEDPAAAVAHLSSALAFFEASGPAFRLPLMRLERARIFLETGDRESAREDLEAGFDLLRETTGSFSASLYLTIFDGAGELVDMLVDLQAEASPARAFVTADEARGSGLPAGRNVPTPREVQSSLPPATAMLYYSLHRNELLVWTVTASRATLTRKPVGQDEVDRLTQRFLRTFTLAGELGGDAGHELAEILLGANDLLAGVSTLVIVPDGPLGNLPFSALPDPRTGRHLAESAAVLVAPSATHYLLAREHTPSRARDTSVGSALVVGDPRGESDLSPDLPALPGASGEAHRVASLYRSSHLLLGREATRRAFLRDAPRHEVIHFAGHATRPLLPSMAGLVLSPESGGSPLLLARDVSSLGLNGVRLVVLSACGTGVAGRQGTAGHESLAQAFLSAGVPSVLASLWPVADATTSGVVESFHRHFLDGLPPAQALRAAQLEALRSPDPAARSSWAAFQLIGS